MQIGKHVARRHRPCERSQNRLSQPPPVRRELPLRLALQSLKIHDHELDVCSQLRRLHVCRHDEQLAVLVLSWKIRDEDSPFGLSEKPLLFLLVEFQNKLYQFALLATHSAAPARSLFWNHIRPPPCSLYHRWHHLDNSQETWIPRQRSFPLFLSRRSSFHTSHSLQSLRPCFKNLTGIPAFAETDLCPRFSRYKTDDSSHGSSFS